MITVDIAMPYGGSQGGLENILYEWSRKFPDEEFELRFFHSMPGFCDYLKGYEKQWSLPMPKDPKKELTIDYLTKAYRLFIEQQGPPDICLATWIPLESVACRNVRDSLNLEFPVISFVHSIMSAYETHGLGDVKDLVTADAHICITKIIENEILKEDPEAITLTIGNPLDPIVVSDFSPDDRTICFVGRLSPEKNVDCIIRAVSKAKEKSWKLLIAGQGPLKPYLERIAKELDIEERVTFLGWLEKPWDSLTGARFCVLASEYEGCNGTTREASSIGMTVISTPVGGVVDYIIPGVNGYIYRIGSSDDLAMILDAISDGKLPICDENDCRRSVVPYYSDEYFRNLKSIFKTIVNGH